MSLQNRDTTIDQWEVHRPDERGVSALNTLASLPPEDLRRCLEYLKATGPAGIDLKIKDAVDGLFDGVEHGA